MRKVYYLLFFIFLPLSLFAQEFTKEELVKIYIEDATLHAALYHGRGYLGYPRHYVNHPYLVTPDYTTGDLFYGDVYYPEVSFRLDWYSGQLIINTPDRNYQIILSPERFFSATIHDYQLRYHWANELPGNVPEGYYLHLYDAKVKILKRENVILENKIVDSAVEYKFLRNTRYYIFQNGKYQRIGSQQGLLSLFPLHKKELKKFIKQQKLSYKDDSEKLVVEVVKQYEKLTQ